MMTPAALANAQPCDRIFTAFAIFSTRAAFAAEPLDSAHPPALLPPPSRRPARNCRASVRPFCPAATIHFHL